MSTADQFKIFCCFISEKMFILPSFWRSIEFFANSCSFSVLKGIYCHSYLCPSELTHFFLLLAAFKIFLFLNDFEQFDYYVLWDGFLHVSCTWNLLTFSYLWVYSLYQIQTFFGYFFCPITHPSGSPISSMHYPRSEKMF